MPKYMIALALLVLPACADAEFSMPGPSDEQALTDGDAAKLGSEASPAEDAAVPEVDTAVPGTDTAVPGTDALTATETAPAVDSARASTDSGSAPADTAKSDAGGDGEVSTPADAGPQRPCTRLPSIDAFCGIKWTSAGPDKVYNGGCLASDAGTPGCYGWSCAFPEKQPAGFKCEHRVEAEAWQWCCVEWTGVTTAL